MKIKLSAIAILVLIPSFASASFLPQDVLDKATPTIQVSDITEAQFNASLREIQDSYAEIVRSFGGTLSLRGDWKSEKLNAGATQMGNSWQVVITGALARRPELTLDGFSLIVCHELGHHLAGFPFSLGGNPFQQTWAANEGQADYFSTQVCARKIWAGDREKNATFRRVVPEFVQQRCDTAWPGVDDQNLCYRVNAAVNSMTETMAGILKKPPPAFNTPDPAVVPKTSDAHPAIQCRMDTVFQGSICAQEFGTDMIPGRGAPRGSENSENAERASAQRTCTSLSGHVFGLRPACWFKPRM